MRAIGTVSLLEFNKLKKENQQLKEIIGIITFELEKSKKKKAQQYYLAKDYRREYAFTL